MPFTAGYLARYGDLITNREFRGSGPQPVPHAPYLGGAGVSIRLTAITARQARSLDNTALTNALLGEVYTFAEQVVKELQKYPPPVQNARARIRKAVGQSIASGTSSLLPQAVEWPRSHNLQRHWRIRPYRRGDAQGYDIVNDAREGQRNIQYGPGSYVSTLNRYYARYVQGPPHTYTANEDIGMFEHGGQQTRFHGDHGWISITDALEKFGGRKELKEILQDVISDHLATAGLPTAARK